jgi:hypothetical protein
VSRRTSPGQLEGRQDRRQQVVEVVRHAGRQLADRVHALGLGQLLLEPGPRGHVDQAAIEPGDLGPGPLHAADRHEPARLTRRSERAKAQAGVQPAGHRVIDLGADAIAVERVHAGQEAGVGGGANVDGHPEVPAADRVPGDLVGARVPVPVADVGGPHGQLEALLALGQRPRGGLDAGDVGGHAAHAGDVAVLDDRAVAGEVVARLATRPGGDRLEADGLARGQHLVERGANDRVVRRVGELERGPPEHVGELEAGVRPG